uniref:Uracil phosphoribosyltransferase (FUR1) homolog (S. cerevisiae) n=1 Tax=Salmo trutta TaxID=8032 RepID=A0A674E8V1_SALTR
MTHLYNAHCIVLTHSVFSQIRVVVEEGLNQLPYSECTVTTPTGHKYDGVKFEKGNCGVSIMRSGEAMEQGLRDCCRSIRIVYNAKFPLDINRRKVLLMYPILTKYGSSCQVWITNRLNTVLTPPQDKEFRSLSLIESTVSLMVVSIIQEFPEITILTTEVYPVAPTHFGQRYFGTD